jgi:hypothetical protein
MYLNFILIVLQYVLVLCLYVLFAFFFTVTNIFIAK